MGINMILYIAAAICFFLGAFNLLNNPRVNLVALGLFLWVLAAILA